MTNSVQCKCVTNVFRKMIGWKYAELLKEAGIDIPEEDVEKEEVSGGKVVYSCCGETEEEGGSDWTVEGMLVCWTCGKVLEMKQFVFEDPQEYPGQGSPLGSKSQHGPAPKRRIYKRLTHFKEHIRRYVGARFTPVPEEVMKELRSQNINTADRGCYEVVKQALKKLKKPKLYKEIFTIIYDLGGTAPKIDHIIKELYDQYSAFDHYFEQLRESTKRKNGISFYMVLDMMLKEQGYESAYDFPYLKNEELQDKVREIFKHIRKEQRDDAIKFPEISREYSN